MSNSALLKKQNVKNLHILIDESFTFAFVELESQLGINIFLFLKILNFIYHICFSGRLRSQGRGLYDTLFSSHLIYSPLYGCTSTVDFVSFWYVSFKLPVNQLLPRKCRLFPLLKLCPHHVLSLAASSQIMFFLVGPQLMVERERELELTSISQSFNEYRTEIFLYPDWYIIRYWWISCVGVHFQLKSYG